MYETFNSNVGKVVVCLAFRIGQRVKIVDIDTKGTVSAICISRDGLEYQVKWFNDAETRFVDWFQAVELEAF